MNIRKCSLLLTVLLIPVFYLQAQTIDNVQFPFSTRWKQIETEYFILIFPENLEKKADNIAAMIDSYVPADQASLRTEISKWPVIINNSLINSNAWVLGAPSSSQLYTIPPQGGFTGTDDWLPSIWSHELRHIVQNEKILRGFTKFSKWLSGEYGPSGMSHFAVPQWLWEGDAVLAETLLTSGGRGRLAEFERGLRTNTLNGLRYSYFQAGLGGYSSYSVSVPSWYVMGYHLCTYIRKEYGMDAFNSIIEISADYSFTPLILNIAVRKVTGEDIETIYSRCLDDLEHLWEQQLAAVRITDAEIISRPEEDNFINRYPLGTFSNGSIAVLKTSMDDIYRLVETDEDGTERLLRRISPLDTNISFNGSEFCWAENRRDVRWGNRSWSVIRKFNPVSGEYRIITNRSRYLSPSLSPDGSLIAAVEISGELDSFIVVLDAETGRLISKHAEPESAAPSQTCWTEDGSGIIYIRQHNWMKSLRLLNPYTGENRELKQPSLHNISSPFASGGSVYFVSEESGLETIQAVQLQKNPEGLYAGASEPQTVVSRRYGTASPAAGNGKLYFSDYSVSGFALASAELSESHEAAEHSSTAAGSHVDYFEGLEDQEPFYSFSGPDYGFSEPGGTAGDYKVSDYYPALGLFNFHSRSLGSSYSGTGITFSLKSDSILNDSSGSLYAGWDPSEKEFLAGGRGAWAGWYPVLLYGAEVQTPVSSLGSYLESSVYGGVWLPFDFSAGIISHSLSLQGLFIMDSLLYPVSLSSTAFQGNFEWDINRKSSRRDIVPPLGSGISGMWYYSINPLNYNFIFGEYRVYLPGLLRNHGLKLMIQADYNLAQEGSDREPVEVPRGLNANDYAVPLFLNSSINYILPLMYPEVSIGSLIYIPRLFMNCFLDTAYIPDEGWLQTAGMEFFMDFHLITHYYPFRAGIRLIYNTLEGRVRIEDTAFSIGIDLL